MAYKSEWLVHDHLHYFELEGMITLNDLIELNTQCVEYAREAAPNKLHLILNCLQITRFPIQVRQMMSDSISSYHKEKNLGFIVIVTTNSMIRLMSDTVLKLSRARFHVVPTVDDGLVFLRKRATDIVWEPAEGASASGV